MQTELELSGFDERGQEQEYDSHGGLQRGLARGSLHRSISKEDPLFTLKPVKFKRVTADEMDSFLRNRK